MGRASKHRKEMKLKLSCVLESSPICLTKVRIKMLTVIYYRCSLAVNNFETVQFCLVKMWCSDGIFFIPLHVPLKHKLNFNQHKK